MHIDPNEEKAKEAEEVKDGPGASSQGQEEAIPEQAGAGQLID